VRMKPSRRGVRGLEAGAFCMVEAFDLKRVETSRDRVAAPSGVLQKAYGVARRRA
jgi:hypothetical protein